MSAPKSRRGLPRWASYWNEPVFFIGFLVVLFFVFVVGTATAVADRTGTAWWTETNVQTEKTCL